MKRKSGLICSTAHCQAEVRDCYVPGHIKCLTYYQQLKRQSAAG
jgi:hypothetical protein